MMSLQCCRDFGSKIIREMMEPEPILSIKEPSLVSQMVTQKNDYARNEIANEERID